ncbi:hypothetical protein AB0M43_24125 [Longispora sp. NPDC051575]|uniref:hypothetical protein n=1 Tax=Longispora sp. NPDC051575 TaxID=3154943 RepID=UPI003427F825
MRLLPEPSDQAAWTQLKALARAVLDEHHRAEDTAHCVSCHTIWPCQAADLADFTLTTTPHT